MKPTSSLAPDVRHRLFVFGGIALGIIAIASIAAYFIISTSAVSIDTAMISAPLIDLSPTGSGRLNAVYAHEGDNLQANTPVALVGTEVVKTKVVGTIMQITDTIGAQVNAGQAVVEMIDPSQLRVVGKIDETKGLAQVRVGDPVSFIVDAFGSQSFTGVVDEVAPMSNQSDIVFNISSQRETQQFSIKTRFDTSAYPQLKNGMSARMWIYKQ